MAGVPMARATKKILLILVIATSALIIRSFFLPWATVETSARNMAKAVRVTKKIQKEKVPLMRRAMRSARSLVSPATSIRGINIKRTVSGYEITRMLNKGELDIETTFMEALFRGVQNINKKSYILYIFPLSAMLCIPLSLLGLWFRSPIIMIFAASEALALLGIYNLKLAVTLTGPFGNLILQDGIWFTLYGFVALCAISVLWLIVHKGFDKKNRDRS